MNSLIVSSARLLCLACTWTTRSLRRDDDVLCGHVVTSSLGVPNFEHQMSDLLLVFPFEKALMEEPTTTLYFVLILFFALANMK